MTTATLSSTHIAATRLRITQRGRRVLAGLVALPLVVAIGFGVLSGGAALASRTDSAPAGTFETVTVMSGESLWSLAEEIAPTEDPRDVVDAIVRLNSLDDAMVRAGQRIALPAGYSSAAN